MDTEGGALELLGEELQQKEKRDPISFEEYLDLIRSDPRRTLRNIFQLFYDMVTEYVHKEEDDEYVEDPESIGFVRYDCSKLFVEGADNPFFADMLFTNRFVRQVGTLIQGFQQNRIYVYDGPSGSGKSTFLNNLLRTFEAYTSMPEGQTFEIVWDIDDKVLNEEEGQDSQRLLVPCPSHDYPIMVIPKDYRSAFLEQFLPSESEEEQAIKKRIFSEKEYEWLFRGEACTICKSIFWSLFEKLGSLEKVLGMLRVRPYRFDRRVGEGISIFNPGDKPLVGTANNPAAAVYFSNKQIQERLDAIFGINSVRYIFSSLAKTNNGIYVLMDIKSHNKERLLELHNVLSEGVHKVGDIEESIHSLFFALMNPEDKSVIEDEKMESFQGRVQYNHISYVLEPATEASIYRNIFGESIDKRFQPRVLENFARVVISSRMETECEPLKGWISSMSRYRLYCDEHGLLLRMEIYGNNIPAWLSEEDRNNFKADVRKAIVGFGQEEGTKGFSGRDSIGMFSDFFSRYGARENLVNMDNVVEFFKRGIGKARRDEKLPPKGFLASLVDSYDYAVLNEMKEALYFSSKDQIKEDILHYLCAVNYEVGDTVNCKHTGDEIHVTADFLRIMASRITGREVGENEALRFARDVQKKYIMAVSSKRIEITHTELYRELFASCVRNLKENALQPFVENENFREAIKAFGSEEFKTFDARLREHVSHMINNLVETFGYSDQGAKEICVYVLDNNLVGKFSKSDNTDSQPDETNYGDEG